jgi:hypothetical protein
VPDQPSLFDLDSPDPAPPELPTPQDSLSTTPMPTGTDLPLPLRGRSGNHDDGAVELLAALAGGGVALDQVAHRLVDAVPVPPLDSADWRAVAAWLTDAVDRCPDYWVGVRIRRAALALLRRQLRARRWAENHEQAVARKAAEIAAREAGTYWRDRDARRAATRPVHIETSDESWSVFKAETIGRGETVGEILGALVRRVLAVREPLAPPAEPGHADSRETAVALGASPGWPSTTRAGDPSGLSPRSAASPPPGRWAYSLSGPASTRKMMHRRRPGGLEGSLPLAKRILNHLQIRRRQVVIDMSLFVRAARPPDRGGPSRTRSAPIPLCQSGAPSSAPLVPNPGRSG